MIGTSHNFTTDSFYNDMTIQSPSTFQILHIVIQVILFCVGLYFQVRTVLVCIEEKNKTWQIHIAHSIAMTIYFCYIIPFQPITYFIPSLATHLGNWICYVSAFISFFCFQAMVLHSLLIAIMKYIFIVHTWKARSFGEERIQRICLLVSFMYPVILSAVTILLSFFVPNSFQVRPEVQNCFGKEYFASLNSNGKQILFCDIEISDNHSILSVLLKIVCIARSCLNTIIGTNIPEGFFYFMTFRSMKR